VASIRAGNFSATAAQGRPAEPEFCFKLVDPTRDDSADKG